MMTIYFQGLRYEMGEKDVGIHAGTDDRTLLRLIAERFHVPAWYFCDHVVERDGRGNLRVMPPAA